MRSSRSLLLLFAFVLCVGNVYVTLSRSTIPLGFDGMAEPVEIQAEDRPGIDDVFLLPVGGEELHVDQSVAERVIVGERLHKETWSSTIRTGDQTFRVEPSRDFYKMLFVMPVVFVTLLAIVIRRPRRPPRR